MYVVTALAFAGWKSELSRPLIDAWNAATSMHVERVPDTTDLIALTALPVSYVYFAKAHVARRHGSSRWRSILLATVMLTSLFAFTATSSMQTEIYVVTFDETTGDNVFTVNKPPADVISDLKTLRLLTKEPFLGTYEIDVTSDVCKTAAVDMRAGISDAPGRDTRIELREARNRCPDQLGKSQLLDLFRTAVIDRVNTLGS